jgi:hypothetical protein
VGVACSRVMVHPGKGASTCQRHPILLLLQHGSGICCSLAAGLSESSKDHMCTSSAHSMACMTIQITSLLHPQQPMPAARVSHSTVMCPLCPLTPEA